MKTKEPVGLSAPVCSYSSMERMIGYEPADSDSVFIPFRSAQGNSPPDCLRPLKLQMTSSSLAGVIMGRSHSG